MATYNVGWDRSFTADIDFSACGQYCFVKTASTVGNVTLNTTSAGSVIGVLQNNPRAGEEATVRVAGFSKVKVESESGSAFTYGCFVASGSNGQATGIQVGAFAAGSGFLAGRAMETVSTTSTCGLFAEMLVLPQKWA